MKQIAKFMMLAVLTVSTATASLASTAYASSTLNITQYQVSDTEAGVAEIIAGPDGAMWYSQHNSHSIGRISMSGEVTEYPSGYNSEIGDLVSGPDGAIWFTNLFNSRNGSIQRLTTTGDVTNYTIPYGGLSVPRSITVGYDDAIWFLGRVYIGRLSGGEIQQIVPSQSGSYDYADITAGPDDAMWYTAPLTNSIHRITSDGTSTPYVLPTDNAYPLNIVKGSDGALWFTEYAANKIGRITVDGNITEYPIPTPDSGLSSITNGPDGALWFTQSAVNKVGKITASGEITEYDLSTGSGQPGYIASGPDGALWYTDGQNKIGRFKPVTVPDAPTELTISSPTRQPILQWNASASSIDYEIYRDGTKIGESTSASFTDTDVSDGDHEYFVKAVNAAGTSQPSNLVQVTVDKTAPNLGIPSWTVNPKATTSNTVLTMQVSDSISGIQRVEYYLDNDPGAGKATPVSVVEDSIKIDFGTELATGVYDIGVRAQDNAGNWSSATNTMLVVFDPAGVGISGRNKNDVVPSLVSGDKLPGLNFDNQADVAEYGLTVDYKNAVVNPNSEFHFTYRTGEKKCMPGVGTCHTFALESSAIDWLVTDQTNNSRARFRGTASMTVDGNTTINPFTVEVIDGNRLDPVGTDRFSMKIYAPWVNVDTATPLYQVSSSMPDKNSVRIR